MYYFLVLIENKTLYKPYNLIVDNNAYNKINQTNFKINKIRTSKFWKFKQKRDKINDDLALNDLFYLSVLVRIIELNRR